MCGNNTSKVVPSCSMNYQNGCVDVCGLGHFRFILNMWKVEKYSIWDQTLEILKIGEIFKLRLNSQNTQKLRNIQIEIKLSKYSKFEKYSNGD